MTTIKRRRFEQIVMDKAEDLLMKEDIREAVSNGILVLDLVGKTIRQAYARAGLPYTRPHLLRHTVRGASWVLEATGSVTTRAPRTIPVSRCLPRWRRKWPLCKTG